MFEAIDILYIVLAFCVLWFTAFICWLIWQIAMMLKNVNDTMSVAREKIEKIEQALTSIRGRFDIATTSVGLLVEGVKKMIDFAMEKRGKSVPKPKKTK